MPRRAGKERICGANGSGRSTTDSTTPTTDTVDILCFYGDDGRYETVATGVTLGSDGSFSVRSPLETVADGECRLAAVPSGQTTLNSDFTGPQIQVSEREVYTISGGPKDGKLYDYYIWGQHTAAPTITTRSAPAGYVTPTCSTPRAA